MFVNMMKVNNVYQITIDDRTEVTLINSEARGNQR